MDKRRLLLIVVCSFASAFLLQLASRHLRLATPINAKSIIPATAVGAASRSLRPNFPYSVIAGGAYSPAELRYAAKTDHLVSGHYDDFDLKSAHLVRLTDDRFQYVSYRLKNHIYWTRRKLRIPKGEVLLTDGTNFARTRCGNRLSSKPGETSPEQPAERTLSLPPFTPAQLTKGEVTLAPPPPVDELLAGAPALPFDLPRLAPYVPFQNLGGVPVAQQIWPPFEAYPPGIVPVVAGPPPIGPGTPGGPVVVVPPGTPPTAAPPDSPITVTPILPIVPVIPGTPTTPISEVPEPASWSLLAASISGLLWLLARVMRTDKRGLSS